MESVHQFLSRLLQNSLILNILQFTLGQYFVSQTVNIKITHQIVFKRLFSEISKTFHLR